MCETDQESSGSAVAENKSSKKRKASDAKEDRLGTYRNKKYRDAYHSYVLGIHYLPLEERDEELVTSQIGGSVWTATEKDFFFHALARKGRHDNKSIAATVGSKNEIEVARYIALLNHALTSSQLSYNRPTFVIKPQNDAACEISVDCSSVLERAAGVLQKSEDKAVVREQGDNLWLLTPKIGKWANKCLREKADNGNELFQTLPAAALLNLSWFLQLSKNVFMNSSDAEWNWHSYSSGIKKPPTITHAAFSDLHALAISITKRLVHSSLCFATSRLKAVDVDPHPPKQEIKKEDVLAALDVLGMTKTPRPFWIAAARRLKLLIYENVGSATVSGKRYHYDELEEILSSDSKISSQHNNTHPEDDGANNDGGSIPSDSQTGSESGNDVEMMDDNESTISSERSSSLPHSDDEEEEEEGPKEPLSKEELEENLQDEILEKLDKRASQAEEARMWELLGAEPASRMDLTDDGDEKLQVQVARRKDRTELVDWTSWTDYAAEWETLGTLVPEDAFRANRRSGQEERSDPESPEPQH